VAVQVCGFVGEAEQGEHRDGNEYVRLGYRDVAYVGVPVAAVAGTACDGAACYGVGCCGGVCYGGGVCCLAGCDGGAEKEAGGVPGFDRGDLGFELFRYRHPLEADLVPALKHIHISAAAEPSAPALALGPAPAPVAAVPASSR
jgi:hypothetical protein